MLDLARLRAAVTGPVLTQSDPGFSEEVTGWLLNFSHTPDVVVGVASVEDVAAAVAFANEHDLPVHVQGTGHGADAAITDGMLITTKRLDTIEIDARARLATIGAGLEWARVVAATAPLGLAPITGSSGTVGAVGFLLGGGLGPLVRSHGFGSDWVREFQVVTGSGEVELANTDENRDLFWALRGGKGGLGIVTRVTVELVPLSTIYGGSLTFDAPDIDAALRAWIEYIADGRSDGFQQRRDHPGSRLPIHPGGHPRANPARRSLRLPRRRRNWREARRAASSRRAGVPRCPGRTANRPDGHNSC